VAGSRLTAPGRPGSHELVSECGHRAVLVVTRSVEGTSTNVVRERIELRCQLEGGHTGEHRDPVADEVWQGERDRLTTLLRDETEPHVSHAPSERPPRP
jgi:hypothetical protein